MSFSRNGWAVCILSANGAVSNVTLRQAASSGATVTYEVCSIFSLESVTVKISFFWYALEISNQIYRIRKKKVMRGSV